jgi:hypothetical protein
VGAQQHYRARIAACAAKMVCSFGLQLTLAAGNRSCNLFCVTMQGSSSRVMLLDFANSCIHRGMDSASSLARMELVDIKACCNQADLILGQRWRKAAEMHQGSNGTSYAS